MEVAHRVEDRGNEDSSPTRRLLPSQQFVHPPRVALDRSSPSEGRAGIAHRCNHVEGEDALENRGALVAQVRTAGEDDLVGGLLDPEGGIDDELLTRRQSESWVIAKNGMP